MALAAPSTEYEERIEYPDPVRWLPECWDASRPAKLRTYRVLKYSKPPGRGTDAHSGSVPPIPGTRYLITRYSSLQSSPTDVAAHDLTPPATPIDSGGYG